MQVLFEDGFSYNSFLNLSKQSTESLYKTAIEAPSNNKKAYSKDIDFKYYFKTDESMNAGVSHSNNVDYLIMNTGTIGLVFNLFYNIFSRKDMLIDIGVARKERNNVIQYGFDFDRKQLFFNGQPECEDRHTIANFVSLLSIRYINNHELGHLLNGHVFLGKEKTGRYEIAMADKKMYPGFSPLDRRTIEMDADAFAATQGIINIIEIFKKKEDFDFYLKIIGDPLRLFELWAFAIHSIFLLFERLYGPTEYNKNALYLPFIARQRLNLGSAMNALRNHIEGGFFDYGKSNYDLIMKSFSKGIRLSEEYFNELFKTRYYYFASTSDDIDYIEFTNEVLEHWKTLKEDLDKYARTTLYNPK